MYALIVKLIYKYFHKTVYLQIVIYKLDLKHATLKDGNF